MGLRDFLKRRVGGTDAHRDRGASPGLPSAPDADGYRAVAPAGAVQPGRPRMYVVQGDTVAVFQVDGALFAIDNACSHEDGPLGEGAISGGIVTCPYHDWRYDVRTGSCLTEPSRRQACFAVRERDGYLWVGPRTRDGTRDRGGEHDDGLLTR